MPVRPSLNGLIRRTVDIQATKIVQEEMSKVDGSATSSIKTIATMADLHALPDEQRYEGVIYIVLSEDMQFLYDPDTGDFISRIQEMDGGSF